jgi:hypothetical protein
VLEFGEILSMAFSCFRQGSEAHAQAPAQFMKHSVAVAAGLLLTLANNIAR